MKSHPTNASIARSRRELDAECYWLSAWLVLAVAVCCGCSSSEESRSATVTGKVTLGGTALTSGNVLFMTEDGHADSAALNPDGTYSLLCRPDRFKVAVTPPDPVDPLAAPSAAAAKTPIVSIPSRYHDLGTSGLSVELKAGENKYDISLSK